MQNTGWLAWLLTLALFVLACAAIALAVVAIRYLLLATRRLEGAPQSEPARRSLSVSMVTSMPDHLRASPVPPENPHSAPTPPVGTPRVR